MSSLYSIPTSDVEANDEPSPIDRCRPQCEALCDPLRARRTPQSTIAPQKFDAQLFRMTAAAMSSNLI